MSSNIDSKWYLVSLKPLDTYFFGGENTFGEGNDEAVSYFAISNEYPQQTSLLGLVRYILLEQNDALPLREHKDKGNALIGKKGFQITDYNNTDGYGAIEQLGALMIKKGDAFYRVANPYGHLSISLQEGDAFSGGYNNNRIPLLEGYDPKGEYGMYLVNQKNDRIYFDDVFIAHEQVGIKKLGGDNSFFRQTSFRLAKDFRFTFWLKLKNTTTDGLPVSFGDTTVFFGGERKPFLVTIEKESTNAPTPFWESAPNGRKFILLSDTYADNSIFKLCDFALNNMQDFRTVSMGFDGNRFVKSSIKMNLLKRGSILFIKEGKIKEAKNQLTENANFTNIGFNQFFQEDI